MFRKTFATLALVLCATAAFALPKPSEVKAAFASGDYLHAESMLKEVMAVKPTAAVHYQLGQVYAAEGKHKMALNEYRQAQALDPTLKFSGSAATFTKNLATEQQLVAPAPLVAQVQVPQTIVVPAGYATPPPMPQQAPSSGGSGMGTVLFVFLLIGAAAAAFMFFSSKKEKKTETDTKAKDQTDKSRRLLDMSKQLEDAILIAKTATYSDADKDSIVSRIAVLQTTVRNKLADLKDGIPVSEISIANTKGMVNHIVDQAENGIKIAAPVPAPTAPVATPYVAPVTSMEPAPEPERRAYNPPAPAPTVVHHYHTSPAPAPVVVNSNDGLIAGLLIGEALSNHHERTVYVERDAPRQYVPAPTPVYDTPRYQRDTYEEERAPAPAALDTSDNSDDYTSSSSSDSSSMDSSSSDDDSY